MAMSAHGEHVDDGAPQSISDIRDVGYRRGGPPGKKVSVKQIVTLLILVYINLLNYMDRYTVSSVLDDIQKYFNINKKQAGLLQTIFVCAYMVFAPVFGYLGDRYKRKYIMAFGIALWTIFTFAGSLMGKSQYWYFFILRGLVGIGEASYSTIAPTIIADLFIGDLRTRALSLFYFAIPCGSGLGYIVGSKVAVLMGHKWQWALRVTPALGVVAVLLSVIAVHEPKRGLIEALQQRGVSNLAEVEDVSESLASDHRTTYIEDVKKIFKVRSFTFATVGFTCVSFVLGAFSWWAPDFAYYSVIVAGKTDVTQGDVSYIFGIDVFVAGIIGVWIGAELARKWRATDETADALVCAVGVLGSVPFIFFALYFAASHIMLTWILIAFGQTLLCLNWAPNADILLYVIGPTRRSTASAFQILVLHILGDAFSPFLVGAISDAVTGKSDDPRDIQKGLLYALFTCPFLCIAGALCYVLAARSIGDDRRKAAAESIKTIAPGPQAVLDRLSSENGTSPVPNLQDQDLPDPYANDSSDVESSDLDATESSLLVPAVDLPSRRLGSSERIV